MKYNNNSIQGIFVYDDDSEYEVGDFVVYQETIYICKSAAPAGTIPGDENYFYTYLGDKMTTIEDYEEFVKNGVGNDKYISFYFLKTILDKYSFGYTLDGFLKDNSVKALGRDSKSLSIFWEPEYSSVCLMIPADSELLKDIYFLWEDYEHPDNIPGNYLFKQYAYKKEEPDQNIYKVQELIDPENGLIFYRTKSSADSIATHWKAATVNTFGLQKKINNLLGTYNSRVNYLQNLEETFKNNFRYTGTNLRYDNNVLQLNFSTDPGNQGGYILVDTIDSIFSLVIQEKKASQDMYITYPVSFNPADYKGETAKIYVSDFLYLSVEVTESIGSGEKIYYDFTVNLQSTEGENKTSFITSYFYQQYYAK